MDNKLHIDYNTKRYYKSVKYYKTIFYNFVIRKLNYSKGYLTL